MHTPVAVMDSKKQRWWAWHRANPSVYEYFERFTFEAIDRGHKKLSAWLIVNRIRWETTVVTSGGDFKISNDFIAYYARLFMHNHPEHRGFFRTRPMKEEA
jgi:hypothetical protein